MFGFGVTELMILTMLAVLIAVVYFIVKLVKNRNKGTSAPRYGSKFCSKCGTEIDVNDESCSSCGLEQSYFGASAQDEKDLMLRRGVALLEIIGGILGVVTALDYLSNSAGIGVIICLLFAGFYGYSVLAGYWLWQNLAKGYRASVLLQLLQIPVLVSPLLTYEFVSGLMLRILIGTGGFDTSLNFGSQFTFELMPQNTGFSIGVNCVPVVVYYLLKNFRVSRLKEEK